MIKRILCVCAAAALCATLSAQPKMSWEDAEKKADELISRLTLQEKLNMTHGYNKFFLPGVPSKGIPFVYMTDASVGVRIIDIPDPSMQKKPEKTTQFPASIMLASTFNPELAEKYGHAVGEECRMAGVGVLLGPGMNIYRNAQCGRNFEYCGEDPYLAGSMVAPYVKGMQETGTVACLKHFLCNNTEFYRRRSNSIVDERAIMEIYTPSFKAGIDAGAGCVMTSYNQLNGEWAGQSKYVIKGILRGDLGFRGLVMTDWKSIYDWKKVVLSGQNVDMPGDPQFYIKKTAADFVAEGALTEKDIEDMIRPQIATCIRFGLYDRFSKGEQYDDSLKARMPEHVGISYQTAAEGVVMLENNGILPLSTDKKILLIGPWASKVPQGGGSSKVVGYDRVSMYKALKDAFGANVILSKKPTEEEISKADAVIVATGTVDEEGTERPMQMSQKDEALVRMAVNANKNTVVVVFTGSAVDMSAWNKKAASILYCWYPGQNGCDAVKDIIVGKVNPSGKLPMTIERSFADSPAFGSLPEGAKLHQAKKNPNEHMFQSWTYDIHYTESILVGYRWYEKKGITPLYPFGYGKSYTTFGLTDAKILLKAKGKNKEKTMDGDMVKVSVCVKNTGAAEGKEVVQLYVSENTPTVIRPNKELKAFSKVNLKPGEKTTVEFEVKRSDLAFWSDSTHSWTVNPGQYTIHLGTSSADIAASLPLTVK